MAVTAEFESNWLEMQNKYGAGIDSGEVPLLAAGDIDASVTIPAAKFTAPYVPGGTNIFQDFRHVPMTTFVLAVQAQAGSIVTTWEDWFGEDPVEGEPGSGSGIRKIYAEWLAQTQEDWDAWFGTDPTTTSEGSGIKKEWAALKTNAQNAIDATQGAAGEARAAIADAQTAVSLANVAVQRAETSRQQIEANESTRQTQETARQNNEQTRQSQESARQLQEATRQQNESGRQSSEQARQDQESAREAAEQGRVTAETARETQASNDHARAEADHAASETATNEASKVDADLTGMTVTITNRNGVAKTVDLSFDFYASYPSVAAMNADVANIPKCSLVSIATTNKTDPENARVYQKRSDGTMIYIGDLDQASAEAWADWLNNKKPEIDARIATADADHTRAESDHTTADADHTQAGNDHQTANSDHEASTEATALATQQARYAKDVADHPTYIADGTPAKPGDVGYAYQWNYTYRQYERGARIALDWDTMSEAEKEAISAEVLAQLVFASDQTCEEIIEDLF